MIRFCTLIGFFCLSACCLPVNAQQDSPLVEDDYFTPNVLRYENYIYDTLIQSVQLNSEGWDLSLPVFRLNDIQPLKLSFDDLSGELTNYMYTFVHCNAHWQPSELGYTEYINGLDQDYINDYKYSRNTTQKYIHYNLSFPNRSMEFIKSGNYLLKVYHADEPDNLILTWRFMVVEEAATIIPDIKRATYVEHRSRKQEVDFILRSNQYALTDPYSDLTVVILQNSRWDNLVTGLKPVFVKNNEIVFDYDRENLFEGENEFRAFDTRTIGYRAAQTRAVTYEDGQHHFYLKTDQKRTFKVYLDQPDINGQRLIKRDGGNWDSEIDADYVHVHFELSYHEPLVDGGLFIFGSLTNWDLLPEAQLKYNPTKRVFEKTMYLKQGFYNYEYVYSKDGNPIPDASFIEGSHFQTNNLYSILVYHRSIGGRYDKLIAAGTYEHPGGR